MKNIQVDEPAIAEFCRRHGVARLSFFGSVLRDDFRPDSDIDVLVEFLPGRAVGLIRMAAMERELSTLLGRRTDLRTPAELSRFIRDRVVAGAEVRFVAG